MKIELLRDIGRQLIREIPLLKQKPLMQIALGTGASGDKTFPIDKKAEEIIISKLEASGEPLTIVSEEAGIRDIKGGGRKVLIDPIDGSKNAIAGIPFYCASIAVADGDTIGKIETAYVINLVNGDEFWAEKDKGAFLNNEKISTQKDKEMYLIAYEAQTPGKDIKEIMPLLSKSRKTRCLGATALDLAYLACGSISVFVNPSLSRSFDFGGGWLLVKEAGGIFTDVKGNSIEVAEISLKKNTSLLASGNEELHEEALRLLTQ
ncbi:MAG: inositol monophosphatase family protein [Thermodesulfovibrionales bacterium]|nr:inositol monophosphatase family protein [Thermodesulfovibrionales bacterium]